MEMGLCVKAFLFFYFGYEGEIYSRKLPKRVYKAFGGYTK